MSSIKNTKKPRQPQLRLRVFAGPNGSGKSTIIESVRNYDTGFTKINFGYYINADEIAARLKKSHFDFGKFDIAIKNKEFEQIAIASGLIGGTFSSEKFKASFSLRSNLFKVKDQFVIDRLAQIIADALRKLLLKARKRFSFETVFSHESKLDIMREAAKAGYKVYLYFVSTEDPEINIFRVQARKSKGGHDVPEDKIVSRYYRSLDLLYGAAQVAYQAFFYDNSEEGQAPLQVAHFKIINGQKKWDAQVVDYPEWFKEYYASKIPKR